MYVHFLRVAMATFLALIKFGSFYQGKPSDSLHFFFNHKHTEPKLRIPFCFELDMVYYLKGTKGTFKLFLNACIDGAHHHFNKN